MLQQVGFTLGSKEVTTKAKACCMQLGLTLVQEGIKEVQNWNGR